ALRRAEQAAQLGPDAGVPVNQRPVTIERRPPRHRPSVCTALAAAQARRGRPGPVTAPGRAWPGMRALGLTQMRPGLRAPGRRGLRRCRGQYGPPRPGDEAWLSAWGARMADYFLRIDGIAGESQNPRHRGEIEVESFSWSETHLASAPGAGGAGKVHVQDLHITKPIDKASPLLMLACASGRHITSAVLTAQRPGKEPLDYLTISLGGVT